MSYLSIVNVLPTVDDTWHDPSLERQTGVSCRKLQCGQGQQQNKLW